jgi:hypothetical protein
VLWAGDVRRKLFANFGHYTGQVAIITVTGPGQKVIPWDRSRCTHPPGERCDGRKGCKAATGPARVWNLLARRHWRELHRTASQNVRRRKGGKHLQILGRVWEYQRRGVLHVHVVVGVDKPVNRHAARLYTEQLQRLHAKHGFGWPDAKWSSYRGQNAAAYLASYFIAGKGRKATVRETVTEIDVPPQVVYVSTKLTRATGVTMRSLRRQRYMHVLRRELERGALVIDVETGELVPRGRPGTVPLRT